MRGLRAPGRTEDAGLRLWSKVPDKRLTNKALSPGTRLASRTWGRRREKERGPSQMQPCAPQGGRIWEHSYCKWTGLRLMGREGHLAVPICPVLCPEPRGPGWVVCVFHISINPICFFFFFFRLLFTLLKIYFHMEQKSAPPTQSYRTAQRSEGQMHGHGGLRDTLCPVSRGSSQRGLKVTCCQLSWVPAWEHGTSSR